MIIYPRTSNMHVEWSCHNARLWVHCNVFSVAFRSPHVVVSTFCLYVFTLSCNSCNPILEPGNCFLADLVTSFPCVESRRFVSSADNTCPLLLPEIPCFSVNFDHINFQSWAIAACKSFRTPSFVWCYTQQYAESVGFVGNVTIAALRKEC